MADAHHLPLTRLVELLSSRQLSAVELMESTFARIEAHNPTVNAFVALADRESALEAARDADARIGRGEGRPLEGIPLGVKDLEDAEGFATTMGSLPFRDAFPERDSVQVERLRAAGAIVIGKTNSPEFGYTAITKNLIFGVTRNPRDLDRTPGGSSGGASAAIAGGLVALATASDGGGSIRLPATFTGCYGHKPSLGRIPNAPKKAWVTDDTSVVGPLTRTVEDAALHLDLTVGPDAYDPKSLPHPGYSYRERLRQLPSGLRIGFSPDLGHGVVQSDVAEVVADAVRVFEDMGHTVEEMSGGPPEMGREWALVSVLSLAGALGPMLPEREGEFGRAFIAGVKAAQRMTVDIFYAAQVQREKLNRWCRDVFERYDLLLTPTTISDPPPARGPLPTEVEGRKAPWASTGTFTIPFNLGFHPAGSVRAGMSKAGLPVGLQIVAPRHRDDLVLQAAWAFEQARPWQSWPEL